MPPSIGVNLRVTGQLDRGDRKYMEDVFSVAYQQTEDRQDLEFAFFGIFDGHGGREAAVFAKEHLMDFIVSDKRFWSDDDDDVLHAISNGYIQTHYAMWKDQVNWPKTSSGLPSTSGTTASVAFIRKGKIYIGHVGDSSIVLGYQEKGRATWSAEALTTDHKPEDEKEEARIRRSGGKVVRKSGVPRVVWNRPRLGHKGPVRRSTPIDEIPFLAVARSLGDLWSYNSDTDEFIVSPEPDVLVIKVDVEKHRCLIFGTDGLWNMLSPLHGVNLVQTAELHNEKYFDSSNQPSSSNQTWINPSKHLVDCALSHWRRSGARADNTSAVTLMLDPPGPPRRTVLRRMMQIIDHPVVGSMVDKEAEPFLESDENSPRHGQGVAACHHTNSEARAEAVPIEPRKTSDCPPASGGVAIFTRFPSLTPPIMQASSGSQMSHPNQDQKEQQKTVPERPQLPQPSQPQPPQPSQPPQPPQTCIQKENLPQQEVVQSQPPQEYAQSKWVPADVQNQQPPNTMKPEPLKDPAPLQSVEKSLPNQQSQEPAQPQLHLEVVEPQQPQLPTHSLHLQQALQPQQLRHNVQSQQRQAQKIIQGTPNSSAPVSRQNAFSFPRNNPSGGQLTGVRRRHSSVLDGRTNIRSSGIVRRSLGYASPYEVGYEPGTKRRTRSEDKSLQSIGCLDDEMRTSDEENERVAWPANWIDKMLVSDEGSEENSTRNCSGRRRRKWLRSSGNSFGRMKQARTPNCVRPSGSFTPSSVLSSGRDPVEGENSPRILRSDTLAAMPVRTLRSRNVDLKTSRLSLHTPSKGTPNKRAAQLKAALTVEIAAFTSGSSSLLQSPKLSLPSTMGSALAKRHRQTFCGRTRAMTTRSRVKRLSK